MLLRAHQINFSKILFRNISNAHVLSFLKSICAYGFDHLRETLSATTTTTATHYEAYGGAPSTISHIFDEAASAVLLD